jgi:Ca-activated chloride channel family protein
MILQDIGPDSAPRGGTMIGDAIRKAIEQFEKSSQSDRAIVLITDGGDQESVPIEAAKAAAEQKIRIISVGLGDPSEGARIPQRSNKGELKYLQHEGQEVWSKMEDKTLKEIAVITSGAYIPAQTLNYDLGKIYSENLEQLRRGEMFVEKRKRFYERFQIPGCIAILLLMAEQAMSVFTRRATR